MGTSILFPDTGCVAGEKKGTFVPSSKQQKEHGKGRRGKKLGMTQFFLKGIRSNKPSIRGEKPRV